MNEQRVFVTSVVRTPLGAPGKGLDRFMSSDLAAKAILRLLEKNALDPLAVDQVVLGQSLPSTMPNNIGHFAWLKAELPVDVPGYTVQSNADSGLQALRNAYNLVASGNEQIVLAGGADSYSAAPFVMRDVRLHFYPQDRIVIDSLDEAECCTQPEPMSRKERYEAVYGAQETPEEKAFREKSREKAAAFREKSVGAVVPLSYTDRKKGEIVLTEDEWLSSGSEEILSPQADAAAAALVMSEEALKKAGLSPIAEILGIAACGGGPKDPNEAGLAAAEKLLAEKALSVKEIAAFEIRENSAAEVLRLAEALGADPEKTDSFGGALAFGDGGGAEAFLMLMRLMSALKSGEKGLLVLPSPGGMGMAALVEKC